MDTHLKPNAAVIPAPLTPEAIWRQYDADEQRLSAPLSARMLELAQLAPGMRVLDLASGRGEPAIPAARCVAPDGSVLGVDLAGSMLQMARERAAREAVHNLELREGDAQTLTGVPAAHFDVTLARWCLMYFSAPKSALRAAHRALRPGGKMVIAVWAEPERVPYYSLPRQILARYTSVPPIAPDQPGTFYYATQARLAQDLHDCGFALEHSEEMMVPVMQSPDAAGVIAWCRAFGMERLLQGLAPALVQAWEHDMAGALAPFQIGERIHLGGVSRLVLARAT